MKRKLAVYLILGTVLAASTGGAINVFGQNGPVRPSDNNAAYLPIQSNSAVGNLEGPFAISANNGNLVSPTQQIAGNPFQPNPNMPGGKHNHAFIMKKSDGTFEQIEKEPGVPFSPEEMQQVNEAKRTSTNH